MHPLIYVPRPHLWVPEMCGELDGRPGNCHAFLSGAGAGTFRPVPYIPTMEPGAWLWVDPAYTGVLTYATQPTMSGWSGTSWAGSGLGPWTHTAGDTTDLSASILTVGNRYSTAFSVGSYSAGTVTAKSGATAGTARSANGSYTEELTCTTTTGAIWTPSTDFAGTVTISSIANKSLTTITPRYTAAAISGLTLGQATAANQPWAGTTLWNGRPTVQHDGTADYSTGSLAAASGYYNAMHLAAGCTIVAACYPDATATGDRVIIDTCNRSPANSGVYLAYEASNNRFALRIGNGGGTYIVDNNTTGTMSPNTPYIVEMQWSQAMGSTISCNGANTSTTSVSLTPSTGNASGFGYGARANGAAGFFSGRLADVFIATGTACNVANVRRYMAAKYGVTVA